MRFWDKHPKNFRILFFLASLILLSFIIYFFISISISLTDGNRYSDIRSPHYIIHSIPGLNKSNNSYDSIESGTLLLSINENRYYKKSKSNIIAYLDKFKDQDTLSIKVYRLANADSMVYLVRKSDIPEDFIRDMSNTVEVLSVDENGASQRAGLKIGDIIYKYNGMRFTDALDLNNETLLDKNSSSGRVLNYEIIRSNESKIIKVEIAKIGIKIPFLILILSSIIQIVFALFLIYKKSELISIRLTSIFLFLCAFTISSFVILQYDLANTLMISNILKGFISIIGVFFTLSVFFHSSLYFPNYYSILIKRKIIVLIPYLISSFITLLLIYSLNFKTQFGKFNFNFLINILIVFLMMGLIFYIITIRFANQKEIHPNDRKKSRLINFTMFSLILFVIATTIVKFTLNYFSLFFIIWLNSLTFSYFYIINKHNLLEIEFKIKKNILYSFITTIWQLFLVFTLVYIIYFLSNIEFYIPRFVIRGMSVEFFDSTIKNSENQFYAKLILVILSFIASLIIYKFGRLIQEIIDKKYFRTKFDYEKATEELASIFGNKPTINDLGKEIIDIIIKLVHLKYAGVILFKNEEKIAAQKYYGFKDKEVKDLVSVIGKKIIEATKSINGNTRIEHLPDQIREIFYQCKFDYLIPIFKKDKLVGIILIGEKQSEAVFQEEDFKFLNAIVSQASVAIENSFLYEDLTAQERIKHELDLARRIQLASLPQELPQINGLDISGISIPALEVGGDFYDYLYSEDSDDLYIVIGDVSGKGTSAALYMSKAQGVIRTLNEFKLSPKNLLVKMNSLIYKFLERNSFISAIVGKFDTSNKTVLFSRAGHLPLYVYRANSQEIEIHTPKGMVLGMTKSELFENNLEEKIINYNSGDIFLFITDGIIEARNMYEEEFEEERLLKIFKSIAYNDSLFIRNSILNSIKEFASENVQYDDITLVIVKAK